MPTSTSILSPRAVSDALVCPRRFWLARVSEDPGLDPARAMISVHELVAQLVAAVERAARTVELSGSHVEAFEAGLLDRARRTLRRILDAQPDLPEAHGLRPSTEDLRHLVEEDRMPPGVGLPRVLGPVDPDVYASASVRLLRGAVGVLSNGHARAVRSGRVELVDERRTSVARVGNGVSIAPQAHLLYRRPDGRMVGVIWRTGRPVEEHRHHAVLVEEYLRAGYPHAPDVAALNAYVTTAHEELLREGDADRAAAYWAQGSLAVVEAFGQRRAPPALPVGSKPCQGCTFAAPACGRSP